MRARARQIPRGKDEALKRVVVCVVVLVGALVPVRAHAQTGYVLADDLFCSVVNCGNASADPAVTDRHHVADLGIDYRLHTPSLNSAQQSAINSAAGAWNGRSRMTLTLAGYTTNHNPDSVASMRLVWEALFDDVVFGYGPQFADCTSPPVGVACTVAQPNWNSLYSHSHLADTDTVFWDEWDYSDDCQSTATGAPGTNPDFNPPGAQGGTGGVDADQLTQALHEFGHWQFIDESSDSRSVMKQGNVCRQELTDYDEGLADRVYSQSPHNSGGTHSF
jgi:hypothetical protein